MATGTEVTTRQLVKLREFSTQLAQRLKDAPGLPTEPTRLAVRIGDENFLVEMGIAGEIVPLPDVAPVPWTKPWYRGLANVRGRLIGVVDLMQLTGRPPLAPEQAQQVLVFGESLAANAGILVSRAFGIRNLKDLTALPAAGPVAASWEQVRYRDADMNQLTYFLPHLLALSCSSPFWEGERTGLMSFRLMIFNGVPRTGLPERFSSWGEYRRHTDILVETGIIADTSRIWWDLRPSARYPTLETRVMDCCTSLEDALSLAALNQCLVRMLWRLRRANQRWRMYSHLLLGENRWRAMRYSYDAGLLDLGRQRVVPFAELLEELIALVAEDAAALGCSAEIARLPDITARGTSAHRQLRQYEQAVAGGATPEEALQAVVAWLVEETAR